jgi:hypothetical protein
MKHPKPVVPGGLWTVSATVLGVLGLIFGGIFYVREQGWFRPSVHSEGRTMRSYDYAYNQDRLSSIAEKLRNSPGFGWLAHEVDLPLPYEISPEDKGEDLSNSIVAISAFFLLAMPLSSCWLIRSLVRHSGKRVRAKNGPAGLLPRRVLHQASSILRYALPFVGVTLFVVLSLSAQWLWAFLALLAGFGWPRILDLAVKRKAVAGRWAAKRHWKPALAFCSLHLTLAAILVATLMYTYHRYSNWFPQLPSPEFEAAVARYSIDRTTACAEDQPNPSQSIEQLEPAGIQQLSRQASFTSHFEPIEKSFRLDLPVEWRLYPARCGDHDVVLPAPCPRQDVSFWISPTTIPPGWAESNRRMIRRRGPVPRALNMSAYRFTSTLETAVRLTIRSY